jgi:hypothetical protein
MRNRSLDRIAGAAAVLAAVISIAAVTLALAGEKGYMGVRFDGNKIVDVLPGTPAAMAGFKAGDIIMEIDGKETQTHQQIVAVLGTKSAGDSMKVKYKRDGKTEQTTLTLGKRPQQQPFGGRTNKPPHYERKGEPLAKDKSLKAGLKWIASQQQEDGSFPFSREFGKTMHFRISITSLAGMALMTDPEFKEQVQKTLEFILKCCHEDGYVYHEKPSFKGMWEHGFATQFLAEALIRKKKLGEDTSKIEKKLKKAVELIKSAQNLEGGWGYRAVPDPHAEVGPGAAMLDALLLSKRAGIPVENDVIKKALKSQCVLMLPPGKVTFQGEWRSFTYEANAFVLSSLLGWKDRPDVKVYLEALEKVNPAAYFRRYTEQTPMRGAYWTSGYHTLGLYYTAVACRRMGDEYEEKFGKWHKSICEYLAKYQNEKGAWKGWFGDVYGTAFACLTLAAETDELDGFKAADEAATPQKQAEVENPKKITLAGDWNLKLNCSLAKPRTRHDWQGYDKTVKSVGLKQGAGTMSRAQMQTFFPDAAIAKGSSWVVPEESVSKLFATFHSTARGTLKVEVLDVSGNVYELGLRALVKFGENSASHIQTTSFFGKAKIDTSSGKVLGLEMDTISGCIRVRSGQGGYVALNDIVLKIASEKNAPSGE